MDTSENKKRVLELLWRNYETQVAATRRYGDRVTIVLGATVGAIGLTLKFNDGSVFANESSWLPFAVSMISLMSAFVCAGMAWYPKFSQQPSGTDVNRLWQYLVAVDDDGSAATLMSDICEATRTERSGTFRIAKWFTGCMMLCGIALIAAMLSEVLSST